MATYFNDTMGNENLTNEDVVKAVSVFDNKETQAEAPVAQNEDARERAVAASSSAVRNQDGSTTLKNAAGGDLGTIGADGTFAANPDETTTSHLMRDADGNLRWDNGKLAGVRTQPNQDDPRIPKGGFAAQKQAEMDAASKRYAETGDMAGSMTESSKLENAAIRHNARLQRPVDKTNVGPKGMVVGGPTYRERHADFIRNNPNAVSPQEREQFLGGTGSAFTKIAEQQRQQAANEQVVLRDALLKREAEIREKKQRDNAERTAAFGRGASLALAELKTNPVIRMSKDGKHRYACSSVSPETLAEVNAQRREFGSTSNYGNIIAYCGIDTNGIFIGKPSVAVRSMADGQTGKDGNYTYRKFGLDQIERGLVKAYGTLGYDKATTSSTVYDMLGGLGTVGRADAEKAKYAEDANARANQAQEETIRHNKAVELSGIAKALKGSSTSEGSGKFSSEQVQYFSNKQRELSDERSKLDPRKAEDAKRIAEIDEEILDAKAYERIAARQGLKMDGQNVVIPPPNEMPATGAKTGTTGSDVVAKLEGVNPDNASVRKSPFEGSSSSVVNKQDEQSTYADAEKETAWKKWIVEVPREGDDPSQFQKRFDEWWGREKSIKDKLKEGQKPGFLSSGR